MKEHIKIASFIVLHTKSHTVKKRFRISYDEVDEYMEKRGRDEYLSLFHPNEKYDRMLE